jgi:hypothetical protein
MSRGHGRVQRWLLEEGLREWTSDEDLYEHTLGAIGHRWVLHLEGMECDHSHACCESPSLNATRAERESLRRAIRTLEAEPGSRVRYTTRWWGGELCAYLIPVWVALASDQLGEQ